MRNFRANLTCVHYRNYEGQEEILDEDGNVLGNFVPKYGPMHHAMLCVSPAKGTSEVEQFGQLTDYDRTMSTADTGICLNEHSIVWLDGAKLDGPHNYIVKKVAPWKNSIVFALKQVTVGEAK